MTRNEAMAELVVTKLKAIQRSSDTEAAHSEADTVLCELLIVLGYQDVVEEYHKIEKWFA